MEPNHIREAKQAAARTGLVAGTVIFALLGIGIVLLVIRRLSAGSSVGSLWIGIVALLVAAAMLVRSWRRGIAARKG